MNIHTLKRLTPLLMLALLTLAVLLPAVSAGAMPARNSQANFVAIDAYVEAQQRELRFPGLALGSSGAIRSCTSRASASPAPTGKRLHPKRRS